MNSQPRFGRRAFTLVEMLVVIGIIGVIATFAIPAATTAIRGTDVNRAAQTVADQFSSARQAAIVRNHPIEVRFITVADPEQPGEKPDSPTSWKFRAMQLMDVTPSGIPVPLGPIQRLPTSMLLNDGQYSSLLSETSVEPGQLPLRTVRATAVDPPLPRMSTANAQNYSYVAFRYMPDGTTNLKATGNWYVTLHSMMDAQKLASAGAGATNPITTINYYTIQVDPVSGATRSYRPDVGK